MKSGWSRARVGDVITVANRAEMAQWNSGNRVQELDKNEHLKLKIGIGSFICLFWIMNLNWIAIAIVNTIRTEITQIFYSSTIQIPRILLRNRILILPRLWIWTLIPNTNQIENPAIIHILNSDSIQIVTLNINYILNSYTTSIMILVTIQKLNSVIIQILNLEITRNFNPNTT